MHKWSHMVIFTKNVYLHIIVLQSTKAEMAEHAGDLEKLQTLTEELSEISPDVNKAQIQNKMEKLSSIFSTFTDTVNAK